MKKKHLIFVYFTAFVFLSWGKTAHRIISYKIKDSLPEEMYEFSIWGNFLAEHSSDADERKLRDKHEKPKHYIDLENFDGFIQNKTIAEDWNYVFTNYGKKFLKENGTLPWAVLATMDSVTDCFRQHDWVKTLINAADLGHYIGDCFMSLHLTTNYDGQLSEQKGIHARYETEMINDFSQEIDFDVKIAEYIENPSRYLFDILYNNHLLKDSILYTDKEIQKQYSKTGTKKYRKLLWKRSKNFTIKLLKKASETYSNLLYTAWVNAGKPLISKNTIPKFLYINKNPIFQLKNNSEQEIEIKFRIQKKFEFVYLSVNSIFGFPVRTIVNDYASVGEHILKWNVAELSTGIYYYEIKTDNQLLKKEIFVVSE